MKKIIIEWREQESPWTDHSSDWYGSRVPVVGDHIEVEEDDLRLVTVVMWAMDGSCIVRVEFHPARAD